MIARIKMEKMPTRMIMVGATDHNEVISSGSCSGCVGFNMSRLRFGAALEIRLTSGNEESAHQVASLVFFRRCCPSRS